MFYKVIKDNRVIDVLDSISYVRYDKRHDTVYFCTPDNATGFLSSDRTTCYRVRQMKHQENDFDTVELIQIDKSEYLQLKALNMMTPQDIIDAYTLALLDGGVL